MDQSFGEKITGTVPPYSIAKASKSSILMIPVATALGWLLPVGNTE
jgi:hypothetical protein